MTAFKSVGQSIRRRDGADKLTGRAVYPEDISMEGMLHGVTVRSPHAHAKIISIDIHAAEKAAGVVKVLTADDVAGHNSHGVLYKDHDVFSKTKVRRIGDPIAVVLAETEDQARAAAKLVDIGYEILPAVFDPREAMKPGAPVVNEYAQRFFHYDENMDLVHEKPENDPFPNVIFHYRCRKGDTDAVWDSCAAVAESEFFSPFVDHAFLQPESGIAYRGKDGRLVVSAASQYMHFDRIELSDALGIPESELVILNPVIGGAFGAREDITLQIHIALGVLHTGRPVKMTYTREESFYAHSKRHPIYMACKMGADADGKLLAFEALLHGDSGAYTSWAINVMRKAGVHITGPYEIPNVKVDSYAVYTNNPFAGAMRGFGATQVPIAHETLMEMLAEKLGLSSFEIRRRNMFREGSETANGQILNASVPMGQCLAAIEAAMAAEPMEQETGGVQP